MQRFHPPATTGDLSPALLPKASSPKRRLAVPAWPYHWLLIALPTGCAVVWDAVLRGERFEHFSPMHATTYVLACAESIVVWGTLLIAAARQQGRMRWFHRVLFAATASLAFGSQNYFFEQYNAYINVDVSLFATDFIDSVWNQLWADMTSYAFALLPPLGFACALLGLAARLLQPPPLASHLAAWASPALLCAAFVIPTQHRHLQASTPDVLYLNAVGGFLRTQLGLTQESHQVRPMARQSRPLPKLEPHPTRPRNVVLILLESVRADASCSAPTPNCQVTPYTNALAPRRVGFEQLRALDSSTAISLAVLWSGLAPTASREALHTVPLVFDYARAAGYDTAYWTSQNMMFGNARLWVQNLGARHFFSATDLDATSDLDMGAPESLLAARVRRDITKLREPFLAVVQLSNVHYPYLVDPDGPAPFQPSRPSKAKDDGRWFFNHYKNAVHQQDQHVATMIRAFRQHVAGDRTVVLYTSDHGEAFREHGVTGHTFSVFDEEIRVPGWLDAPDGTLAPHEHTNLQLNARDFAFHSDVTPTILDLMGLWEAADIEPFRRKMIGRSWLRPPAVRAPQPLTNCAGVWSCAFENWGYMVGSRKLHARSWDSGYQCYDVLSDPGEYFELGVDECRDLQRLVDTTFGRIPGR